jgi:hypothetical protein
MVGAAANDCLEAGCGNVGGVLRAQLSGDGEAVSHNAKVHDVCPVCSF